MAGALLGCIVQEGGEYAMNRQPIETGSPMRQMLTVREVAHLLHIHENTVRRWSNESIIPSFRICQRGDRRYKQDDIARLIVQLRAHAGNPREAK